MTSQEKRRTGIGTKIHGIVKTITVEPIILMFLLPSVLLVLSIANLNLEKACRVNLQFNETICNGLSVRNSSLYTPEDENEVQKLVTSMNAWKSVIQSVIPTILLLFFGAWSDKRQRRKPFMALPIIGEIVTVTGLILCTYFFYELSMEVTGVVEILPTALAGGWFTMFMAVFSYVTDNSTTETRTVRLGTVNICNTISIMIGIALSGILYQSLGLYAIFSIALVMYVLGLLYTIFVVKEKGKDYIEDKSKCRCLKDFVNINHIKSTFEVAFKPRKGNFRKRILLSLLMLIFIFGPMYGEMGVIYLFVRKRFQWSEVEFSIFYSVNVVLHLLGTIFSLSFFSKYLKIDDSLLGIISVVGKFFSAFIFAFAPNQIVFCSGVFVEILSGTLFTAQRSITTKLVEPDEIGKLSALTGMCEALMPLAYGSLYNLIYKATIDTLPGTFYLVGSVLSIPTTLIFSWFYVQHRRDKKNLEERQKQEELLGTNESDA